MNESMDIAEIRFGCRGIRRRIWTTKIRYGISFTAVLMHHFYIFFLPQILKLIDKIFVFLKLMIVLRKNLHRMMIFLSQTKLLLLNVLLLILKNNYHFLLMMTFRILFSQFLVRHLICIQKTSIVKNILHLLYSNQKNFKQNVGKEYRKTINS